MIFKNRHKLIFLGTAVFFLLCMFFTRDLNLDEKISSMLPDSDPMVKDFNYIINNIPAIETLYIDIENLDMDSKTFYQAADYFFNKINGSPHFKDLVYKFPYHEFQNLLNMVSKNRSFLLNQSDLSAIESKLTPEQIHAQLLQIKQKLLTPSGMFMADKFIQDPLGIDDLILARLNSLKNETFSITIKNSRIYSKNGRHILIMATPEFSALNTAKSINMMTFLNNIKDETILKYRHNIKVRFSGNHVATLDNSQTIQQDVKRAIAVLSIGIIIIGILFFKKLIHVVLIFFPTFLSLSFALTLISLVYKDISAIALGCGALLIGITVDFGIHILFNVDNSPGLAIDKIIRKLRFPVFAGASSTMAAFSCLLFSSLPGQRQMGFFAITGIFGAAFFAVFLLKFFIPSASLKHRKPFISLVGICDRLMDLRKKHIRLFCLAGGVLLIVGLVGIKDFKFEGDVSKLNHLQPVAQNDMDSFLKTWGGFSPALVLVKAKTLESALQKNDTLFELLNSMQQKKMLDQISSLSEILPSLKKRDSNDNNFKKLMTQNKIKNIEKMFNEAADLTGFKKDTFRGFFNSLRQHKTVFSINDFDNTALEKLINSKVIIKENEVLILTTMNIKDKTLIPEITTQIKSGIQGSLSLDKSYFIKTITSLVAKEFKQIFFFAAGAVILVLTLFFRNLKLVSITACPVFLSALITAGILGLLHVPINLISMIFTVFVFGVGVDFSIFLTNHELYKTPGESNITAGAVIICAMTTIGAFASLAFAKHEALFSIGIAGLIGMVISLVFALILIPSLMERFVNPPVGITVDSNDKRHFNV